MISIYNKNKSSGVHPPENKISSEKSIEKASIPKQVILPLSQHIGAPAKPIVKPGDKVKTGQKIAEAGGFVSAPIHATISGEVKKIIQSVSSVTSRIGDAIFIESDGKDTWVKLKKEKNPMQLSNDVLLKLIQEAGIVGLGGATFPTHVKLKPPPDKKIDSIIINGCECEPFITSDHRLMLEHTNEIVKGLEIMMKIIGCNNAFIAIENNKPDAIEKFQKTFNKINTKKQKVIIKALETQYPMGAEKTLLKRILGREVPIGGLPMDVGVVVQNVSTLYAIYEAAYDGKPLIERVVTISGEIKEPKNLLARFGTSAEDLINQCGGTKKDAKVMIFGGPMMGISQVFFDTPLQKGTNSILIKKDDKQIESNCIRCGSCIETCPMGLMPLMYVSHVKKRLYSELKEYYIENCVECGSCAYGCPAKIPIVQYIKAGKAELQKMRVKK